MPDQFPTLEAAATLGFAIVLWRTILLVRDLAAVSELNARLMDLLGSGQLDRALRCCEGLNRASYGRPARRILRAARSYDPGREDQSADAALARVAEREIHTLSRRLRSRRARDLVVLAVLAGAILYGLSTELGTWFVSMLGGAGVLVVVGSVLRHRIAKDSALEARTLVEAAARVAGSLPTTDRSGASGQCPRCEEAELVEPSSDLKLEAPATVALTHARVCPRCGHLEAVVEDAGALLDSDEAEPSER